MDIEKPFKTEFLFIPAQPPKGKVEEKGEQQDESDFHGLNILLRAEIFNPKFDKCRKLMNCPVSVAHEMSAFPPKADQSFG